jgi:tetratricopeptide (TPR) repeat protein
MKTKVLVVIFVVLLMLSSVGTLWGEEKKKVIFDEHYARWKASTHFYDLTEELEKKGYDVQFSDKWMSTLSADTCDVLVLFIPFRYFHDEEKERIKTFVKNGGGLIIIGEWGGYADYRDIVASINRISTPFGIEFNEDVVLDEEKNREDKDYHPIISTFASHPVTKGVKSMGYFCGCSLKLGSSATALAFGNPTTTSDGKKGRDVVILAAAEYGKGRIVAVGDSDFLVGATTPGYEEDFLNFKDNKKLALNMFEWTAPGIDAEEAESLASEADALFSQRQYSQAKDKFQEALRIYTEAHDSKKVSEMQSMIDKCSKGMDAEAAYEKGMEYFNQKKYNEAREEFQESDSLYRELGDTEGFSEAQSKIDICSKILDADAAYEKGLEYFNQKKYNEAREEFQESDSLYRELDDTEGFSGTQSMISACNKVLEAEAAYEKGMEYFSQGKYELAESKFDEAVSLYGEFAADSNIPQELRNVNTRIQELNDKKEEVDDNIDRIKRRNRILGFVVIIAAVAAVFSAVLVLSKKQRPPEPSDTIPSETVLCKHCGKQNVKDASYCAYCNSPLRPSDDSEKENALDILRKRRDKGEITEDEFRKIKKVLEGKM